MGEQVAMHAGERCEFNFGARPFAYPVAGYRAVQQPPSDAKAALWLLGAFKRLIRSAISCGWGLSKDTAWVRLLPAQIISVSSIAHVPSTLRM